jgi:catechol 2,3-dioxygenase-like lactoylglutathione lyase family enzyme
MGQVIGVNHIGISVRDLPAARAFWGALGFEPHLEFAWPVGTAPADEALALVGSAAEVVVLRSATSYLELFAFSAPPTAPRPVDAPGVSGVDVVVADLDATLSVLAGLGRPVDRAQQAATTRCPEGTAVSVTQGSAPGLATVRVRVADPATSPLTGLVPLGPVGLATVPGASVPACAPCDLGANHVCLDVVGIADVRNGLGSGVGWHHGITASSGGIASVCYGTTVDGVVVELLESHAPEAALSRTTLSAG